MGLNNTSLSFNGINRYAKLTSAASLRNLGTFTWMAWIKVGSLSIGEFQRAYVERQGHATFPGIRFACTPFKDKLRFEVGVKDGEQDTNYDYRVTWDDRWHHVGFVARISGSNPTYESFLDGVKAAGGTLVRNDSVTVTDDTAPVGSIYLGNHSVHPSAGSETFMADRYWHGKIDDIVIFNDAKNQTDFLGYFTDKDRIDTTDTALIYYWGFDAGTAEGTGPTTTADDKDAGRTGTLYQSGAASAALWTIDRPYLGNDLDDVTAPSTPTLPGTPTTTITPDGFTATWILSTDNIYVQYNELQVSTSSSYTSYTAFNLGRATTYSVTGLLPALNYYWRVRAFDAAGNSSGYSTSQSLTTTGTGDQTAPVPPVMVAASGISHVGFTLNWLASVSSDETGYKVDVADDADFTTYLLRNVDVGNVLAYAVSNAAPLTNYYVRIRAYDAAQNESVDSTVLVVQTLPTPDITAPTTAEGLAATSVTSTAFVANWNAASDDVGVVRYFLDVGLDAGFTAFATGYQNRDVGNVTSYPVTGLAPNTGHFYRARGADQAGNISANPTVPVAVSTTPSTIDEGGYITTISEPTADSFGESAAPNANHGLESVLRVAGNGSANTKAAYLLFNLTDLIGQLHSASLALYVTDTLVGNVAVKASVATFDEVTLTWNLRPTISGSTINMQPININTWVEVDVTSLLLAGHAIYVFSLTTTVGDEAVFVSREGTQRPQLIVESDPLTATQIDTLTLSGSDAPRTNWVTNPSFENNTATDWLTIGSGATMSVVADGDGKALRVVGNGSAVQGAYFLRTDVLAVQNDVWSASASLRVLAGTATVFFFIYEYDVADTMLGYSPLTISTLSTTYRRYGFTYRIVNAAAHHIRLIVQTNTAQALTMYVDKVLLEESAVIGPYFDGDTSGAWWDGTARASISQMNASRVDVVSTYIGDSDEDNSVALAFKRSSAFDWVPLPTLDAFGQPTAAFNRLTKHVTASFGSNLGIANVVRNPSFELDVAGWAALVTTGSIDFERDTTVQDRSNASLRMTLDVFSTAGVIAVENDPAAVGQTWSTRARVRAPAGVTVKLLMSVLNASNAVLASAPDNLINTTIGTDAFVDLFDTWTLPASTATIYPKVVAVNPYGHTVDVYVDEVSLHRGALQGYLDGSKPDGVWEGAAHASATGRQLSPETAYDVRITYTDPDGMADTDAETTTSGSKAVSVTTPRVADDVTTSNGVSLTAENTVIRVAAHYIGDDNGNATARIEYKRTDLADWRDVQPVYERATRTVRATIESLLPGTSYTVRVTYSDIDGTYGVNPQSAVTTTTTEGLSPQGVSMVSFGGFVLMGRTDGIIGVSSHNAFGLPNRRVQVEDLARLDGAVELQNLWGSRPITITGFVSGADRGKLADNLGALKRALVRKKQRLVVDTLTNLGRYYIATLDGNLDITEEPGNVRHLNWKADFICADPFAYDAVESVASFATSHGGTATINNGGDLSVEPYLLVKTTFPFDITLTITNRTTGDRITPVMAIKDGDRLSIDTATKSLLKNGVEIDFAGSFPELAVGANEFAFAVSTAASGTPSLSVEIRWRHRYL